MLFSTPRGGRFSRDAPFTTIQLFRGLLPCRSPVRTSMSRRKHYPTSPLVRLPYRPVFFPSLGPFPYLFPVPAPASLVSAPTSPSSVRYAPCPPIVWSGPPIPSPSARE